jgi:hypothetical protein
MTIQFGGGSHNLANQQALQPGALDGTGPITNNPYVLLPNTPNQPLQIFISNPSNFGYYKELAFNAMIGDGGPNNTASGPGVIVGPSISADVLTGTVFSGDTLAHSFSPTAVGNQIVEVIAQAPNGETTEASGLLATVFIDTTGFTHGTWELDIGGLDPVGDLAHNANGNGLYDTASSQPYGYNLLPIGSSYILSSSGSALPQLWFDTSITIVPEPSSLALAMIAFIGLLVARLRRRD